MTETPRTDAYLDGKSVDTDTGRLSCALHRSREIEASLIATQKELDDLRLTMMRNSELFSDNLLRTVNATNRAEKAEQALALRGEPVAKEKIREIAESCAQEIWGLPILSEVNLIETAIHAGIALYAAPISGEQSRSLTDDLMDCVDRLGSEADSVDPKVWGHLLVYAPAVSGERVRETEWEGYPGIAHDFEQMRRERDALVAAGERVREALKGLRAIIHDSGHGTPTVRADRAVAVRAIIEADAALTLKGKPR